MFPNLLAIVGPTASGKSSLALSAAQMLDGEIVSCDSMQIYTGMDIGTAKPTAEEQRLVRHHMIDICSPDTDFSCAQYASMAADAVREIQSRGKLPIVCGGTGLYLDSLLCGERFAPDLDPEIEARVSAMSPDEAYALLCEGDPASAGQIHPNNHKRVRRALSILLGTGVPKSVWDARSKEIPKAFDALIVGLDYRDRATLYRRIDERVDLMMEMGLLEEAKALNLRRDSASTSTATQAIGYKELYAFLDGELSLDEAVSRIKQNTRNYAKRQLTWFRRTEGVEWIYPDDPDAPPLLTRLLALMQAKESNKWT